MQIPLQIVVIGMERSEALDAAIQKRAERLERFHPRITSCRVAIERSDKHATRGGQFEARVEVRSPRQRETVSTHHHHEDVYVAIRDAFEAVARRLEDLVRTQRGDVKAHDTVRNGTVARLFPERGYGFITAEDGSDEFYFSAENVVHPDFDALEPGVAVQFIVQPAGEGLQAKRVSARKGGG